MDKIILYTIGCPKCHQLERKLNEKGVQYDICTDIEEMKQLGIRQAPVLSVNGELKNFATAWTWVTAYGIKPNED